MPLQAPLIDPIGSIALPSVQLTPQARPDSSAGLIAVGQGVQNVGQDTADIETKMNDQANTAVLLGQQKGLDDWEAQNIYDPQNGALQKRGQNALGVTQTTLGDFDKYAQTQQDNLSNTDQQLAFEKMALSRRQTIERTMETHEGQQIDALHVDTAKAASDSAVNRAALYFNQPAIVQSSIDAAKASTVALGHFQGLPDDMIANNVLATESKAHLAVLTRMSDNDPSSAINYFNNNQARFSGDDLLAAQRLIEPTQRKVKSSALATQVMGDAQPKVDQNGVINYVMNTLEGGATVGTDSNGATVKYGINAAWHKDVDVPNLTGDQASQIYVNDYWNKINGDTLPAALRLPAMSFAATSGPKEANNLIQKSGGDPRKFQQLAQQFYTDLATKDPDQYAAQLPGWMNRLANVSQQIDYMHGQLPDVAALNNKIDAQATDPIVASDAKELVNKQIAAMKETQQNGYQAASKEAWAYVQNGIDVPPSVLSKMNPQDAVDMQSKVPVDPNVYETTRQQVLSGVPVDLASLRWKLGNKFDELVELQGDPVKQAQNSVIDNTIQKALPAILGTSKVESLDDYQTVGQFRNSVQNEVRNQQKVTGKLPTPDDVQAVADKMLLTSDGWGSKKLFSLAPGTQATIDAIPATGTHLVNGQNVNQQAVLNSIVKNLRNKGMAVNDANVKQAYQRMINSGQIKYVSQ